MFFFALFFFFYYYYYILDPIYPSCLGECYKCEALPFFWVTLPCRVSMLYSHFVFFKKNQNRFAGVFIMRISRSDL